MFVFLFLFEKSLSQAAWFLNEVLLCSTGLLLCAFAAVLTLFCDMHLILSLCACRIWKRATDNLMRATMPGESCAYKHISEMLYEGQMLYVSLKERSVVLWGFFKMLTAYFTMTSQSFNALLRTCVNVISMCLYEVKYMGQCCLQAAYDTQQCNLDIVLKAS